MVTIVKVTYESKATLKEGKMFYKDSDFSANISMLSNATLLKVCIDRFLLEHPNLSILAVEIIAR